MLYPGLDQLAYCATCLLPLPPGNLVCLVKRTVLAMKTCASRLQAPALISFKLANLEACQWMHASGICPVSQLVKTAS